MKTKFTVFFILFIGVQLMAQNNSTSVHRIGEKFGGGIIFYIDETGQHGLIAAPFDQSYGIKWGCAHNKINANTLNDGVLNTIVIIRNCGKETAAGICSDLGIGGFNDWYLPSLNELALLYQNRMKVDGLTTGDYWSSTEYTKGGNDSWAIHFGRNGKNFYYNKNERYYVRAIRKF
jgi:hypothetical protein